MPLHWNMFRERLLYMCACVLFSLRERERERGREGGREGGRERGRERERGEGGKWCVVKTLLFSCPGLCGLCSHKTVYCYTAQ